MSINEGNGTEIEWLKYLKNNSFGKILQILLPLKILKLWNYWTQYDDVKKKLYHKDLSEKKKFE